MLTESSTTINKGWNLIGNPLVTPLHVNSIQVGEWSWQGAVLLGKIAPIPIVFDSERASHVGITTLPIAAGFWVYSYEDDLTVTFDPANPYCGDNLCNNAENEESCPEDCDFGIPEEWTCPDSYYSDTWCDCGCGAYDPTCDDPNAGLWDNCGAAGCVDAQSPDCNDAVDCDAIWDMVHSKFT